MSDRCRWFQTVPSKRSAGRRWSKMTTIPGTIRNFPSNSCRPIFTRGFSSPFGIVTPRKSKFCIDFIIKLTLLRGKCHYANFYLFSECSRSDFMGCMSFSVSHVIRKVSSDLILQRRPASPLSFALNPLLAWLEASLSPDESNKKPLMRKSYSEGLSVGGADGRYSSCFFSLIFFS